MYEEIVPQPKEKSDQYPLPILRLYQCQRTGMSCRRTGMITLSTLSYSSTTKSLLEYSYGWLTISPYCRNTWQDQLRNLSNRHTYGIPSGHTPLQDLLQDTGIPWYETGYLLLWCKFCHNRGWPTIAICTNDVRPGNSRTKHVDLRWNGSRIACRKETSRYIMFRQASIWLTSLKRPYLKRPSSVV